MWTLLLVMVTTGSPALFHAAPVHAQSGRCSFAGVLHIEGTSNYSLTFQQALELCQSLGYKLATQKQVTEAYDKGLRTCRYGWIDGQKVMFLPQITNPNCDPSFTELTLRSEAAEYHSDVYCFNPSDSFDPNCEDAVKSDIHSTSTAIEKPNEDILEEALIEGFLVDVENTMDNVQKETSSLSGKKIPTQVDPNTKQNVTSLQRESITATLFTRSPGENSDTQIALPVAAVMDLNPSTEPALEEPTTGTDIEDAKGPTNKFRFRRSFSSNAPSVLLPETEGSGSGSEFVMLSEGPEPSQLTTMQMTTETTENIPEVIINPQGRMNHPNSPSTPSSQKGKGTPAWLVIFASCVVVGAVLCIFVAIATKDKWYGPKRSKNIMSEDYSKAATLPLSEKEQEIVTLMSVANLKNDATEDIKVTCLDEHEREYLM